MPSPVKVSFQVEGVREVQNAFKSVSRALRDVQTAHVRAANTGATVWQKASKASADAQKRSVDLMQVDLFKIVRSYERTQQAMTKAAQDGGRERLRIAEQRVREEARLYDQFRRLPPPGNAGGPPSPRLPARTSRNPLARTAARAVFTGLGTAAAVGGSLLAVGGGFTMVDAVAEGVRNQGRAKDLEIASRGTTTKTQILEKAEGVADIYGTSTGAVVDALDQFTQKSGNVKAGFEAIQQLTELAIATGSDLGEVARTAGIVQQSTNDVGATMGVMRDFAGMGRAGSVDMRELAQYAARISAGSAEFGDKRAAMTQLSAIVQQAAATGGATAAPEATEAVTRFGSDVLSHEGRFKDINVQTRDKTGRFLRAPIDIIKDTLAKTRGDPGQLQHLFGHMSYRAVAGYKDVYNRAATETLGKGGTRAEANAAGLAAVDDQFAAFAKAGLAATQVQEEAAKRVAEVDKQLEIQVNKLREAVGKNLIPELVRLLPTLQRLVPDFASLLSGLVGVVDFFARHPFAGLGAVVATQIGASIARARIEDVLTDKLSKVLGRGSGAGGAPGGLGFGLGAASLVATTVYLASTHLVDTSIDDDNKRREQLLELSSSNYNTAANLDGQPDTPEKAAKQQVLIGKLREEVQRRETVEGKGIGHTFLRGAADTFKRFGAPEFADQVDALQGLDTAAVEQAKRALHELEEQAKRTAAALAAQADAASPSNSDRSRSPMMQ